MVKVAKTTGGEGYALKLGLNLTAVGTGDMSDEQIAALPLPDEIRVVITDAESGEMIFDGNTKPRKSSHKQKRDGSWTGGNINYSIQERL